MGGDVRTLAADAQLLTTFSLTTLVVFVLSGLQIWLLVAGMNGAVGVAAAVGIYGLSQAGGSLSALPFGLGPADAVVVGLLLRTGTPFGIGTTVALLLRGTVTLPIGLAAAAAMAGRAHPEQALEVVLGGTAAESEHGKPVPTTTPAAATAAAGGSREAAAYR
jgi:hypothetical protein